MSRRPLAHVWLLFLCAIGNGAWAQAPASPAESLAARLAAMSAVTGYEQAVGDTLLTLLPGSARDPMGSVARPGAGRARLVACPLDEPGWVVGGVRADGWLTVRRTPGVPVPLRDQQLEGARVTVLGRRGPVPGVVGVRSIHLTRGRPDSATGAFTADSAILDVGARSAAEVERLGVGVLSVVTLAKRPHAYGERLLAAPWAGRRAACAAVLQAARGAAADATVVFAAQHELAGRGLAAVAARRGPFEQTLVVDAAEGWFGELARSQDAAVGDRIAGLGQVTVLTLPVRYAGSPVETVSLPDVDSLAAEIGRWSKGEAR